MVDLIHAIAEFLNLFFAGVLAGEELVICYGVRTVVAVLDQQPQIELRHALIRKLRALVPASFILTALSGLAAMSLDGTGPVSHFGAWQPSASSTFETSSPRLPVYFLRSNTNYKGYPNED